LGIAECGVGTLLRSPGRPSAGRLPFESLRALSMVEGRIERKKLSRDR